MGQQQAHQRGLLNSSMGISAAQNAMVDAGMQIAGADADSANRFALENAREGNTMNRFASEQHLQSGMFNSEQAAAQARFNAGEQNVMGRFSDEQIQQAGMFNADLAAQMARFNAGETNTMRRFGGEQSLQAGMFNANLASVTDRFNAGNVLTASMFDREQQGQQSRFNAGQLNDMLTRVLDREQQTNLTNLNNTFQRELNESKWFQEAYTRAADAITSIEMNPDMQPDAKQSAVNTRMLMLMNQGHVARTMIDTELAEKFGGGTNELLGGGTTGLLGSGGIQVHGASQPGAVGAGGTGGTAGATGPASRWTGEPLGPNKAKDQWGRDSFGTLTGPISDAAAKEIQRLYSIDPKFLLSKPSGTGRSMNEFGMERDLTSTDGARDVALRNAIDAALQAGTVHHVPLTDRKSGMWFAPALMEENGAGGLEGIMAGGINEVYYDPDNVLGLR